MSVISIKGFRDVPRNSGMTKSKMDTLCLTRSAAEALQLPPFQRPLRVNDKVRTISQEIKANGGVIEGVLTLGILDGKRYLVDGQHRREAFLLSGLDEAYADVRVVEFDTLAEMAQEFVKLNTSIVRMRPDDVLRGLEHSNRCLQFIRKECPFIGYDHIRRGDRAPLISMSFVLRTWRAACADVPAPGAGGGAAVMANDLIEDQAKSMIKFFNVAHEAWGRDVEYQKLWGGLNLTLCGWLWNHTVLNRYSAKATQVTPDHFKKGLMALSASGDYLDWLIGRNNTDRDRSPCYGRIKNIIARRLEPELGQKPFLPAPPWASHSILKADGASRRPVL